MKTELPPGYYIHEKGYAGLHLPVEWFADLPATITIDEVEFRLKDEFHVTIINARGVANIIAENAGAQPEAIEQEIRAILEEYLAHNPMQFICFRDDVRLAIKNDRKSLAIRCEISNLEPFFITLQNNFKQEIKLQPAHVSLYTMTGLAVGIDSVEQIESYERVLLPEIVKTLVVAAQ